MTTPIRPTTRIATPEHILAGLGSNRGRRQQVAQSLLGVALINGNKLSLRAKAHHLEAQEPWLAGEYRHLLAEVVEQERLIAMLDKEHEIHSQALKVAAVHHWALS
ncbi:hypothetical protein [Corallococcus terminator]|uniref:Uncharacterized protein n=1 Tax=Corallococcus terminator TaxID=2316733 RepID=A0A3A8HKE1_9BACT|nr:hypothetical protein [Corallococcus terminator]RKG67810.1 hypothetical protein D7V88_40940 [Corallococcus terminator]